MAKYILTKKAVSDLSDIWNYTYDVWTENQADKYYQMLIDNFQKIADKPEIGKTYEGIVNQLLGWKVGRHIIFYRKVQLKGTQIEIIRILHEKMDLKNRINE
jgi:toxin ParE1/3/4